MNRPQPNEYAVFYKGYIDSVPDENIFFFLQDQTDEFIAFLHTLHDVDLQYRYQEGKWTIAELLGHIIDTERVMVYRILRFSRNDKTPIPGFDQDPYVKYGTYNSRSLDSLIAEFEGLRRSNLELIGAVTDEQSKWTGEANEKIFSVRALVYIIAGHLIHHTRILREKYLNKS